MKKEDLKIGMKVRIIGNKNHHDYKTGDILTVDKLNFNSSNVEPKVPYISIGSAFSNAVRVDDMEAVDEIINDYSIF